MQLSSTTTIPTLMILASLAFSAPVATETELVQTPVIETECETTSINKIAVEYSKDYSFDKLRETAINLYGNQTNFTPTERKTYKQMLSVNSIDIGKNIFDFF